MKGRMIVENNLFMKEYKILKFKDCIIQLNTGLNPRQNFSLGKGTLKYITAKNLNKSGLIDFSKCDFIDETAKNIIHKRSDIQTGDILFSSRAPIGHCHLIQEKPDFYDIGESIFSIRVNPKIVLPEYMYLYLTSDYFVKSASKHTTGSVIQEIRIADLMNMNIIVPTEDIQRKISKTIGTINNKIELINQINNNLEELMKTIYQRWFIEFEFPNEDGKPYKSSGGKLAYNEKMRQEIPENWKVNRFAEVTDMYQPITISNNKLIPNGKYNVYGANGIIGKYDKYNHEQNEIAVCCRGAGCGKYLMTVPFSWITGNAMIIKPKQGYDLKEYIYYKLDDKDIYNYVTGSAQPQITRTNIENMKIVIPDKSIIDKFNNIAKDARKEMINLIQEIQELNSLKEYLLPLLMNGQINVDDIEI